MKYILNWPSGAGGDFILSLIALAKKEDIGAFMTPRLNIWGYESPDVLQYRTFKFAGDFDRQQQLLDSMPTGYTLQSHVMNQSTLRLDDDVRVINIHAHDVFVEAYVALLYKIKTVALPADDIKSIYPENSYLDFAINIDYYKLFELQDIAEINTLLLSFDAPLDEIDRVVDMLALYHKKNEAILRLRMVEEVVDRKLTVNIKSFNDIQYWLEQPLGKTLEDQRRIAGKKNEIHF